MSIWIVDSICIHGRARGIERLPRARGLAVLGQRLSEERDGAGANRLEPVRLDDVEAELGVGDVVGKRAAE